jgi:hypothetical protein
MAAWFGVVQAREYYAAFIQRLRKDYAAERVKDGAFGEW